MYVAGAVLGATLVASIWLYTYRTWEVKVFRGAHDLVVVDAVQVEVRPWWAVLGAYSLPLIGAGVSLWLLPEGRRLFDRFVSRIGAAFSAKPSAS